MLWRSSWFIERKPNGTLFQNSTLKLLLVPAAIKRRDVINSCGLPPVSQRRKRMSTCLCVMFECTCLLLCEKISFTVSLKAHSLYHLNRTALFVNKHIPQRPSDNSVLCCSLSPRLSISIRFGLTAMLKREGRFLLNSHSTFWAQSHFIITVNTILIPC